MKSTIHAGMSTAVRKPEAHLPPGALSNKGSETCKRVSFNICAFLGIAVGFKIICFKQRRRKTLKLSREFLGIVNIQVKGSEGTMKHSMRAKEKASSWFFSLNKGNHCTVVLNAKLQVLKAWSFKHVFKLAIFNPSNDFCMCQSGNVEQDLKEICQSGT